MSAAARRKGAEGEREACALLRAYGWQYVRRTLQSGALGGGDIDCGPRGVSIEVKRHAGRLDLPAAMRQAQEACSATQAPMVLHRRDGQEWLATVPAALILELLAEREGLRTRPTAEPAPVLFPTAGRAYDTRGEWA